MTEAFKQLYKDINKYSHRETISIQDYIKKYFSKEPIKYSRSIFHIFHDMVKYYVGEGIDEYPNDPESINFVKYDTDKLFVSGSRNPFFADRLFANRFVRLSKSIMRAQQNRIYIYSGPPGCGKSTFLNNFIRKFEEYVNSEEGRMFEVVWKLEPKLINKDVEAVNGTLELVCPSHDHPILIIPKEYRRSFVYQIIEDESFVDDSDNKWLFENNPCTICTSIYKALLHKNISPTDIFKMVYVRPYEFNRRLSSGVSVYNPGDAIPKFPISNEVLQNRLDEILGPGTVRYIYSRNAMTNNGIYSLMDVKNFNVERLISLHNTISDGVRRVDTIEESVNTIFLGVMNPEDKNNIKDIKSFVDRIEYLNLQYVLDYNTEVSIYKNIFDETIDKKFLPMVLNNFARVVVGTRMKAGYLGIKSWIKNAKKYELYCDSNLFLLKMEVYRGNIPSWLDDEDRKSFNAVMRKKVIAEGDTEGDKGISGRDSIHIFNEFYTSFLKKDKLINMSDLAEYFSDYFKEHTGITVPSDFMESLKKSYDYSVLQQMKESLYFYNEKQISDDIKNYLYALNFDIGSNITCIYTGRKFILTEDFLNIIESRFSEEQITDKKAFRDAIQHEYTTALNRDIMVGGKNLEDTEVYKTLYDRYVYNIKEKVLDPLIKNDNFRAAIKAYGEEEFKTFDKRIRTDVEFLIKNLCEKYGYTKEGAKEVSIYIIDNDVVNKFTGK
uniref:PrkA AAA domain-containing protein n=1 Tax=viral metagenome TaxID=1070528 RepID=A0A6M3LI20_9ZZZZ